MKTSFSFLIFILFFISVSSQSPQKMSYQAVVRDVEGNIVVNQMVGIKISIIQDTAEGKSVYIETHRTATNENGLISIEIGNGFIEYGDFSAIVWNEGPYFIKTEIDPAGQDNYSIKGISQLHSVPYALHAITAQSLEGGIQEKDPLFSEWDKSTGISISENQISDLNHFSTADETDPLFSDAPASIISSQDISNWNNKLDSFTEADPEFQAWDKNSGITISELQITDLKHFTNADENDPVFDQSDAKNITQSNINTWNNKSDFSGNYHNLINKPTKLSEFKNDEGYQVASEDGDVSSSNEIQTLYGTSHDIGISNGNKIHLPDFEGDPQFNASPAKNITTWGSGEVISTSERNKLNSIESGGEVNVQADWNETNTNSDSYILNKIDTFSLSTRIDNNAQGIIDSSASLSNRIDNNEQALIDSTIALRDRINRNIQALIDTSNSLSNRINDNVQGIIDSTDAIRNSITSNIHDADNDTKIQTEESTDEDVIRFDVAGSEVLTLNNTTGAVLRLPTNDANSNLNITKNNGTSVLKVDGSGRITGDGSGLSNVKSLLAEAGGDHHYQITANYGQYNNIRSVSFTAPSSGKCFAMASGFYDWESKGWDLCLSSIIMDSDPNFSVSAENEFYRYLNITTDYNCADSSDQYTTYAQHRCFYVTPGTHTFTLWANKYTSSAKLRLVDVQLTVLFFPTSGTGGGIIESTQLEENREDQKPTLPYSSVPRSPDGRKIENNEESIMIEQKDENKDDEVDINDEIEKLKGTITKLQTENENLKLERSETDARISKIEKQIERIINGR